MTKLNFCAWFDRILYFSIETRFEYCVEFSAFSVCKLKKFLSPCWSEQNKLPPFWPSKFWVKHEIRQHQLFFCVKFCSGWHHHQHFVVRWQGCQSVPEMPSGSQRNQVFFNWVLRVWTGSCCVTIEGHRGFIPDQPGGTPTVRSGRVRRLPPNTFRSLFWPSDPQKLYKFHIISRVRAWRRSFTQGDHLKSWHPESTLPARNGLNVQILVLVWTTKDCNCLALNFCLFSESETAYQVTNCLEKLQHIKVEHAVIGISGSLHVMPWNERTVQWWFNCRHCAFECLVKANVRRFWSVLALQIAPSPLSHMRDLLGNAV